MDKNSFKIKAEHCASKLQIIIEIEVVKVVVSEMCRA
jgi:hypothetical protein